jgi:tRNA pseudouridine55 synthase
LLGILLVDKPYGVTSHDVVNEVRHKFHTKRVGHAGTLDPLATGVLVVAVGPATRFLQYLPLEPKEYIAEVQFGEATDTYDKEGAVTHSGPVPENLEAALRQAIPSFMGLVTQTPPMYSAVKVNGKPLYRYARNGQTIEREPRTIHVSQMEVQEISGSQAKIKILCSGGTYVRTLAHDLGEKLGCGAHLSGLLRTAVGRFQLPQTTPLADIRPDLLIPLRKALPPMPLIELDAQATRQVREGRQIRIDCEPSNSLVGLIEPKGEVFSVARLLGNVVQPECVIPEEAILDAS